MDKFYPILLWFKPTFLVKHFFGEAMKFQNLIINVFRQWTKKKLSVECKRSRNMGEGNLSQLKGKVENQIALELTSVI